MPRPERLIDADPPLALFASDLRALRHASGIKYRQMSVRTNYCVTALAGAASGRYLPTWEVTRAFVAACGGPVDEWRERWCTVRDMVRAKNGLTHG